MWISAQRLSGTVLCLAGLLAGSYAAGQDISTFAGGGPVGPVAANSLGLGGPTGLAVDGSGNRFVSSAFLNQVFKIDAGTGLVSLYAGNGFPSYTGDGGAATLASLSGPAGLAVDGSGNLYIADERNNVIRVVDAGTGVISTFAGNGNGGYSGDGGPATSAELAFPTDVAFNGTDLLIADSLNNAIRSVSGGTITTIAGTGTAGFSDGPALTSLLSRPNGVVADGSGNVYIADTDNERVRLLSGGNLSTLAGNGLNDYFGDGGDATLASLAGPIDVVVDGSGNVYIADSDNNRVRMVDTGTPRIISTVAGNGTGAFAGDGGLATSASLDSPDALVLDGTNLLIGDAGNGRVRRVNGSSGIIDTLAGNGTAAFHGDGLAATAAMLSELRGVGVDASGDVYIADTDNHRVRVVDAGTGLVSTFAGSGATGGGGDGGAATAASVEEPEAIAVDASGNVFISEPRYDRVRRVDAGSGLISTFAGTGDTGFSGDGGPATSAELDGPVGLAVDAAGNVFIADSGNNRIRRVDAATQVITTVAGNGTAGFAGDGGPATAASLSTPVDVAVDAAGNLYIADEANERVRKVTAATSNISTLAGDGTVGYDGDGGPAVSATLNSPEGVAVDVDGNLFITDRRNQVVRRIDGATGIINTVAGNGLPEFSGDGGPSFSGLGEAAGVAVDGAGNLYIAAWQSRRVRRVYLAADLAVAKDDGVTMLTPGQAVTYTITVDNTGPGKVFGATVSDVLPSYLLSGSWTCVASGTGSCGASGTGSINDSVTLAAGETATYTLNATLDTGSAGAITNTATATVPSLMRDPDPSDDSGSDVDTVTGVADLGITVTDGLTSVAPGQAVTYTIGVSNAGPNAAATAIVADILPAALTGVTWTCVASAGATCTAAGTGDVSDSVLISPGATITYTVTGTVDPAATGALSNTATIAAPVGVTDGNLTNNSATDATTLAPQTDLTITKTDGQTISTPGQPIAYTMVASNLGPSLATGATVTDTLAAVLQSASWTCVASAGASCTASGSGGIADTVNLPPGGTVTYTLNATIAAAATGTLSNTATVAAPVSATDPVPANNSATDSNTLSEQADLSVTKTDGVTAIAPGETTSYTIVVSNAGPSTVTGGTVTDTLPAQLTGATWTCAASAGGSCTAAGSGSIADTVTVPPAGSLTYALSATIAPGATGTLTNTAAAAVPSGVIETNPTNNAATDTTTLNPEADLSVTKTDGATSVAPGSSPSYTIVVSNNGPSTSNGATVTDTPPAELTGVTWTCVASAGASCAASGTGSIADTVNLPPAGTATYTLTGTIEPTARGGLVNTAAVAAPSAVPDPTPGNNSATDTNTLAPEADLSVTKTDGMDSVAPGETVTYTIVVSNAGPSSADSATVTDTLPAELSNVSWTCVASTGSSCTASGTDDIVDGVVLPPSGSVTYTLTATVSTAATGTLSNTASATPASGETDPNPANDSATDSNTLAPKMDLSVTKTDGLATSPPGGSVTYTIVAANAGPSDATAATVTDTLPADITSASWTCVASAGGSCTSSGSGNIADTIDLPVGATATYTLDTNTSSAATGSLSNTVSVAPPVGATDPSGANNSATDTNTYAPHADLSVTKTDGVSAVAPGNPVTYTIVAANAGPSDVIGATVADTLPAGLAGASWTCVASAGASCTASGSGSIADTVNLPAGASVTYTLSATTSAAAMGTLSNTATVAPPSGTTDPSGANNSATDTDTYAPEADLSVTKTNGATSVTPGQVVVYAIVVSNAGPSNVSAAPVLDTLPAGLTGATWACSASPGASCTASGSGSIADTATLPVGATATYTVTATVVPGATGSLSNTVSVIAPSGVTDPVSVNNTATDTDTLAPQADLSVTKTDGLPTAPPGGSVTYTIVVSNAGPSTASGAVVTDVLSSDLTSASWTCVAAPGASCSASGTGGITDTVTIPPGGLVTYTLVADVSPSATGALINTASVNPPGGTIDPSLSNNSATDTDVYAPHADLSVTKTDGLDRIAADATATYTIVVSNAGPSGVTGATVTDTVPAVLTAASWTCVPSAGASCTASGSGDITDSVDLAVGASATYTLSATVASDAAGTVVNTATAAAPAGTTDPNPSNNSATDTDTVLGEDLYTLDPCRVIDTRDVGAPIGGGALEGQETRLFAVAGYCGIPPTAKALSVNITATQATANGHIRLFPATANLPNVSAINYVVGVTRANNAIVPLDFNAEFAAFVGGQPPGTTVHLIFDVNGYFE